MAKKKYSGIHDKDQRRITDIVNRKGSVHAVQMVFEGMVQILVKEGMTLKESKSHIQELIHQSKWAGEFWLNRIDRMGRY